jgi:hypothetical protein
MQTIMSVIDDMLCHGEGGAFRDGSAEATHPDSGFPSSGSAEAMDRNHAVGSARNYGSHPSTFSLACHA